MDTNVKVSVIVPVYNAYDYLRQALDGILDQQLKEIEVICVDDGSTDHSLDILKEYQKRDERIRIVTQNNAGPGIARNTGLKRARGEYLAFLDADDFYEPTMLDAMYSEATKSDLDITVCDYDLFHSKNANFTRAIPSESAELLQPGEIVSKNLYPERIFQITDTYVWNKLFKKSFVTEKGLQFPTDVKIFEDAFFVGTALSLANRIGKVEGLHAHHRVYSEQGRNKLFRKYYTRVPEIYVGLKSFLMHHGVYLPLKKSFELHAASRCYKVYNILSADAKKQFWDSLHDTYAAQLGFSENTPGELGDGELSEFIANTVLFPYSQFAKREGRGIKLKIAGFAQRYKNWLNRKKFREFLSRVFHGKDESPKA